MGACEFTPLIHSNYPYFNDVLQHLELNEDHLASFRVASEVNMASSNQKSKKKKPNKVSTVQMIENKTATNKVIKKKNKRRKVDIAQLICYNCPKKSHFIKDCKTPPKVLK